MTKVYGFVLVKDDTPCPDTFRVREGDDSDGATRAYVAALEAALQSIGYEFWTVSAGMAHREAKRNGGDSIMVKVLS